MGIDWETILGAEENDMAEAYEDLCVEAMEKEAEWQRLQAYYRRSSSEDND